MSNDDQPFSLPEDVTSETPVDHPSLDCNLDAHEIYDEGLDGLIDDNPYELDRGVDHFWNTQDENLDSKNGKLKTIKWR